MHTNIRDKQQSNVNCLGFILNETKSGDPMVQKVMELDQDLLNIRKMN